ncbi:MAG TPA: glycoside hydrolase family 2 TIM barrel-domain containing protein [Anaerolineaceae bacterium]|nr:glycoside hydrolase family 2 TIM barrel-domain containing protein [Anaerolineaceae bacterium]HPN54179.1 glycoside hydrolase family 2 TIM barrel-domain containing protein [Anaerolineaceae bacterium]
MTQRIHLSLDGQWLFCPSETFSSDTCVPMVVPAPWQADARFRSFTGPACYRRELHLDEAWFAKDKRIILGFGAVDYFAEVWLNDIRLGAHEGGYLPFELDLSAAAHPGCNLLTVRVSDPPEVFAEIPHGKQSWYGMLSGIWQPVWIELRPAVHIQSVRITPHGEEVHIETALSGPLQAELRAEILAPDGRQAAQGESVNPVFNLKVPQPQAWSPDAPRLYTLRLSAGDDEVVETFGFRTIEARDGRLWLNGQPFYMRAALDQDYYPDLICTPPSQEYIEQEFRLAKDMGLNCLRVHIKVADPRYYAAADKVGLLIWTELPNHALLSPDSSRRARETLAGMIARDWNHPSIGIWTIINEAWGVDVSNPDHRAWMAETYDWVKNLDPTRLVAGNSPCWSNFNVASDLDDFHMYFAMPDHHEQWRSWVAEYARRPWWTFACDYSSAAAWREYTRAPWQTAPRQLAAEARRRGDEPLLVSEFGNWGLPELGKLREGYKGDPWWFEDGLDWGDGVVYPHGMEIRYQLFGFERVFGSLDALCQASQRLQFQALKYEIEQMRRHDSIQGYVITELTDVHWECNGLLDMLRNPKAGHAGLAWLNAPDLLIPLWERLSIRSGETINLPLLLSHTAPEPLSGTVLEWTLSLGAETFLKGEMPLQTLDQDGVTALPELTFTVPAVSAPARACLRLSLLSQGQKRAYNEVEWLLFPAEMGSLPLAGKSIYADADLAGTLVQRGATLVKHLPEADLAVVGQLDDNCREYILRGGRVLWLAEKDDALQTVLPGVGLSPRAGSPWQGDWASSFGWHCLPDLPTGGLVDFSFAGLTPEHVLPGMPPRDFIRDVFAGLFTGWLHRPIPTIARRRIGRGQLLGCTFRIGASLTDNPMAGAIFDRLLGLLNR